MLPRELAQLTRKFEKNKERQQEQQRQNLQTSLFPDWPDDRRGAPKHVIRSAIFGVVRRGRRQRVVDMPVASPIGTTVTMTGWRLDQHDCDVWLEVMHLARNTTPGTPVRFTLHAMLKRLGQTADGDNYARLKRRLKNLTETTISYDTPTNEGVAGALITDFNIDKKSGDAIVTTNPKIRSLWESVSWLDVEQRRSLGSNQLAKAMHAMLAALPDWPPMRLDTLMQRVGAEYGRLRAFKAALEAVLEDFRARGWIRGYTIGKGDGALVMVDKVPTPSQARAIEARDAARQ